MANQASQEELIGSEMYTTAVRAGYISCKKDVVDRLASLYPQQVPSSTKHSHRYLLMQANDLSTPLKFLSCSKHVCVPSNIPLVCEHISNLVESLSGFAYKWRLIGTALNFLPQELDYIQAENSSKVDSFKHCLIGLISDWILKVKLHTVPPTVNNMKRALASQTVGLGALADKFVIKKTPHTVEQSVPYLVMKVSLIMTENGAIEVSMSHNDTQCVTVNENCSTFLGVQTSVYKKIKFSYQWYQKMSFLQQEKEDEDEDDEEGMSFSEDEGCIHILFIHADIDIDGCEFSCQITTNILPNPINTVPVMFKVSCPLDKFRDSLASIYLAQPEVPEDTWPPVSSKRYINLAVIKQQNINYSAEYARLTIRGDMDDILQHKDQTNYKKVLCSLRSGDTLFIEGRPGCGKTTFVHKITRDWAKYGLTNGSLRLLLLVSLRVLNRFGKHSLDLADILNLFKGLKVSKELIEERKGKGVCFIFDGLDEFSPADGKDSLIYKLINRYYLMESTIIVASRPAATAIKLRGKANEVIEILGFQNDQILEYLDYYPFSTTSKAEKLKAYLSFHPNILHMCYLPIHTVMVAFLFERIDKLPRTETSVYTHFTRFTVLRSLSKNRDVEDIDIQNLNEEEEKLLHQICEIALEKTILNKQVLHQDEVQPYFHNAKDLGLIAVDRTAGLLGIKDMYTFLHLTFQEYLAAYHISTLSDKEQHAFIHEHGGKDHMQVVWKFYCGLVSFDGSDKLKKIIESSTGSTMHKIHCAYESQTYTVCELLLEHFNNRLHFQNNYLNTSDFLALNYVLTNASARIAISFSYCNMNVEAVDALSSEMRNEKHSPIYALNYSTTKFDSVKRECLRKLLSNFKALKYLHLSADSEVRKEDPHTLDPTFFFNTYTELTELSLKRIHLYPITLEHLLVQSKNLKILSLHFNIGPIEMEVLAALLIQSKSLEKLCIFEGLEQHRNVEIPDNSASSTKLAPGYCDSLKTLRVTGNTGVECLACSVLSRCRNIQHLDLSYDEIGGCEAKAIFTSITSLQSSLTVLDLSGNRIGREGACAISMCLQYWPNLQKLDVSGHYRNPNIGGGGAIVLTKKLHHSTKLTKLNLASNAIDDNLAKIIVLNLTRCMSLTKLNISENSISSYGACAIGSCAALSWKHSQTSIIFIDHYRIHLKVSMF